MTAPRRDATITPASPARPHCSIAVRSAFTGARTTTKASETEVPASVKTGMRKPGTPASLWVQELATPAISAYAALTPASLLPQ